MPTRRRTSVTICEKCSGDSQIEDVAKQDTRYVKRLRACKDCGHTWPTAEIHLADVKLLKAMNRFLDEVGK